MKRKIIILVMILALSMGAVACDSDSGSTDSSKSTINKSESSSLIDDDSSDNIDIPKKTGEFDWNVAMENFYIDGRKIEVPFSLNSLGSDYYSNDEYPAFNDYSNYLLFSITHKDYDGISLCYLEFKNVTEDEYTDDCLASAVHTITRPCLQGIEIDSTMELVYETWGEPDEIAGKMVESNTDIAKYYGEKEGQVVYIMYNNITNMVKALYVDFENMNG